MTQLRWQAQEISNVTDPLCDLKESHVSQRELTLNAKSSYTIGHWGYLKENIITDIILHL